MTIKPDLLATARANSLRYGTNQAGRRIGVQAAQTKSIWVRDGVSTPFRAVVKSGRSAVTVAQIGAFRPLRGGVKSCWWTVSMTWVACRAGGR